MSIQFESIASEYAELRGKQITENGWRALEAVASDTPGVVAIDDCFSHEYEADVVKFASLGDPSAERPASIRDVSSFLLALCGGDDGIPQNFVFSPHPDVPTHIDAITSGFFAFANFGVSGDPAYRVYNHRTAQPIRWELEDGDYLLPVEQRPLTIPITGRQLLLLDGAAIEAAEASKPDKLFRATFPHEVVLTPDSKRILQNTFTPRKRRR